VTITTTTGDEVMSGQDYRERAEAYDRHLSQLRRQIATYQGGYLHAKRLEAERIHDQWLLANQALFEAEMRHLAGKSPRP
jgi:hypothetical protein